jgi:hypothetical protein
MSILTSPIPGSLEFARQFEAAVHQLNDGRLAAYLKENERELRRALELLFELESRPVSAEPAARAQA